MSIEEKQGVVQANLPGPTGADTSASVDALSPNPNVSNAERLEGDIERGEWWLIRIGVAALIINTIIALIYWGQLTQMTRATKEATKATDSAEWSAYWTCLTSQSAENAFLQSVASNNDSHAMASAAAQQAAVELQSERSSIWFLPRLPDASEINDPELSIAFTVKNEGKGDAQNVTIHHKAVLLGKDDHLRFNYDLKKDSRFDFMYFPAGHVFPERAEPHYAQVYVSDKVLDVEGATVSRASDRASDLMKGGTHMIASFGTITYSDVAGVHVDRFCNTLWPIQAGARRTGGTTPNENKCAAYNRRDTGYSYKPLAQATQQASPGVSSILCVKPKDQ